MSRLRDRSRRRWIDSFAYRNPNLRSHIPHDAHGPHAMHALIRALYPDLQPYVRVCTDGMKWCSRRRGIETASLRTRRGPSAIRNASERRRSASSLHIRLRSPVPHNPTSSFSGLDLKLLVAEDIQQMSYKRNSDLSAKASWPGTQRYPLSLRHALPPMSTTDAPTQLTFPSCPTRTLRPLVLSSQLPNRQA